MWPKLTKLVFTSGDVVDVSSGVTVIAGPNNAGKSALLRDIAASCSRPVHAEKQKFLALDHLEFAWPGSMEELLSSISLGHGIEPAGQYDEIGFQGTEFVRLKRGGVIQYPALEELMRQSETLGEVGSAYVQVFDAGGRLQMTLGETPYNPFNSSPQSPAQRMYADREYEREMSEDMKRAFGVGLVINRYANTELPILVGELTSEETGPLPSKELRAELATLMPLTAQGDGYRAFANLVILSAYAPVPLLIIDEPEAFLHPPQARRLGRMLAERLGEDTQMLVATHSEDIVEGLTSVSGSKAKLTIARLSREGQRASVQQVPTEHVRELYTDPLLRYSRVLSGMFADGAVVCEGDSDTTYFRAVLDHMSSTEENAPVTGRRAVDVHFVHCNGKARVPKASHSLRAAGVPTVSVVDFDILRDEKEFANLVNAHGLVPSDLMSRRNVIVAYIESLGQQVRRSTAKAEVREVLEAATVEHVTNAERKAISKAISPKSGWGEARRSGATCLKSADAARAFTELNSSMRQAGIFVLEGGVLENFHPDVPSEDKRAWLQAVLEEEHFKASEDARKLLEDIVSRIAGEKGVRPAS